MVPYVKFRCSLSIITDAEHRERVLVVSFSHCRSLSIQSRSEKDCVQATSCYKKSSMYCLVADIKQQLRVHLRRLRYRFQCLDKNCATFRTEKTNAWDRPGSRCRSRSVRLIHKTSDYETQINQTGTFKSDGLINLYVMKSWSRAFISSRPLVHKHVKMSVAKWIMETTCPHKHVQIPENQIPRNQILFCLTQSQWSFPNYILFEIIEHFRLYN